MVTLVMVMSILNKKIKDQRSRSRDHHNL